MCAGACQARRSWAQNSARINDSDRPWRARIMIRSSLGRCGRSSGAVPLRAQCPAHSQSRRHARGDTCTNASKPARCRAGCHGLPPPAGRIPSRWGRSGTGCRSRGSAASGTTRACRAEAISRYQDLCGVNSTGHDTANLVADATLVKIDFLPQRAQSSPRKGWLLQETLAGCANLLLCSCLMNGEAHTAPRT